ncbi:replication initiation factor family protein [Carnobacterium maltaromaticum]|nr:replication initiation factor family protein [Carnobacterium maltaromaticum]PLS35919.1 replication initiation factor family protein [Carnobacterium maltaromaticum]PLS36368.1 replication initiation factor family protein [Carnobacterium maltaromaticum]PLS42775.1 replication initiation factor family protein [Carnobacterium maltaromaticum]PLS43061.1 replication initiation factor family protein [Carnobacterium maltaromaticum]
MTENVLGKIDWLQIVCQNIYWEDLFSQLLQISLDCVSEQLSYLKHEEYDVVYSCGTIKYYTYHDAEQSYQRGTLIMSGQACTMYEWALLASDTSILAFQTLAWRFHQQSLNTDFTFEVKRMDLALDDYNQTPFFSLDLIVGKVKRKQFLSKGRTTKLIDSEFDKQTRAKTQQIGAGGSECLFRFYEKAKELTKGLSGEEAENLFEQAPTVRLEAETRHNTANQLFGTLAYLTKEQELTNLIRGFIQTELTFYEESSFDSTLNWYQYQGGLAVTQAIYFLVNHGLPIQPKLIGKKEHCVWSSELAEKLIDFVTQHQRMDLIPLIQNKTKNRSIKKMERSPK